MRLKVFVSAAVAILVVSGATASWAEKGSGKGKKSTEGVPDAVNRQFQWEEKVVGPKDGVDHKKIAAMQEQARRDDAARKKLPPPRKPSRAEGVAAPASSTLPTMDIEKPAPAGTVKKPAGRKPVEEVRRRDALDNLLAEEGAKPAPSSSTKASANRSGLGSILAADEAPKATPAAPAAPAAKKAAARRHHRR
jgi:hypothetical protein